ncbi:hypothetical protein E3U23_11285 [Erythrobacter litoralis]|nr:hypothetical protein [Erythrobacter litoralis]
MATISPHASVTLELVAVEDGSQRFKQALRIVEDTLAAIEEGGQEYPLLWGHAKTLLACIAGAIVVNQVTPDARIPDDQMRVFEEMRDALEGDPRMEGPRRDFFEPLQEEPAITYVEVFRGNEAVPIYSIPRSDFAYKAGFFQINEDLAPEQEDERHYTWDVVLIRPVLVGKERRWTFSREGLEFSALMTDPAVLEAIRSKTLRIPFAEGVMMKVELTVKERFDGTKWVPIGQTRKVVRVLSPRVVLPPPGSLFAKPDGPEKPNQT